MRTPLARALFAVLCLASAGCGGSSPTAPPPPADTTDYRGELRFALQGLAEQAGDSMLRLHYNSVLQVLAAGDRGVAADDQAVKELWTSFTVASTPHSPRLRASYLDRSRPLIVSWTSPTDGQVSFAWLTLPARWDPAETYPVYIQLHGLWDVAQDRLPYLAYPYSHPGSSYAFEDGYLISPWGRGNYWYRGIAETDIWEGLAFVKSLVRVNERRQYLCGHSMGGYGAWHIAHRSADVWAALGVHAGALQADASELSMATAVELRDLPVYIVVGAGDGLFTLNQTAYGLLLAAGNPNVSFVTFPGGHEYRQADVEAMYQWLRRFERR